MPYDLLEKSYKSLNEEQQLIVFNLVISLGNLNANNADVSLKKRTFGKFSGKAKAVFSDNWEMSEEELSAL